MEGLQTVFGVIEKAKQGGEDPREALLEHLANGPSLSRDPQKVGAGDSPDSASSSPAEQAVAEPNESGRFAGQNQPKNLASTLDESEKLGNPPTEPSTKKVAINISDPALQPSMLLPSQPGSWDEQSITRVGEDENKTYYTKEQLTSEATEPWVQLVQKEFGVSPEGFRILAEAFAGILFVTYLPELMESIIDKTKGVELREKALSSNANHSRDVIADYAEKIEIYESLFADKDLSQNIGQIEQYLDGLITDLVDGSVDIRKTPEFRTALVVVISEYIVDTYQSLLIKYEHEQFSPDSLPMIFEVIADLLARHPRVKTLTQLTARQREELYVLLVERKVIKPLLGDRVDQILQTVMQSHVT